MEIYTTVRPLTLPAACAPAGARAPRLAGLPRVHQVSGQAELAVAMVRTSENPVFNGIAVDGVRRDKKSALVASGVPPRGRPV